MLEIYISGSTIRKVLVDWDKFRRNELGELKRSSLVKPTINTRFHIDFDWWQKNDCNWRVYLKSNLCQEHQETFNELNLDEKIDWVDPNTAEVQCVDGLQHVLITHCAKQPGFIGQHSSLVDSVFRIFLANGNTPMSSIELGERLGRPPEIIIKTLASGQVYKGIRPCQD